MRSLLLPFQQHACSPTCRLLAHPDTQRHTAYTITYPATNTCLDKHIVTQAHIFKDSLTNSLTHTPGSWAQSVTQPPAVTLTSSARYRSDKHRHATESHSLRTHTLAHGTRGLFPGRPLPVNVTQAWEGREVSSDIFIAIVWERKLVASLTFRRLCCEGCHLPTVTSAQALPGVR